MLFAKFCLFLASNYKPQKPIAVMQKFKLLFSVLILSTATLHAQNNEWVFSSFGSETTVGGNIQTFTAGETLIETIVNNTIVTQGFQQPYSIADSLPPFYSGNAFTPFNYDNLNDLFRPTTILGSDFIDYEFLIYDRWRLAIFNTTDRNEGWNGLYNTKKCPPGAYVWVVKCKKINKITNKSEPFQQYGIVHLIN